MITRTTLLTRSLRFHWRAHLGVVLGAAVGAAALIGALIVGDSVRASLREMGLARLGKIGLALDGGDRLFRAQLAEDIRLPEKASTVLLLPGMAASEGQKARANRVQVLGINPSFWEMAHTAPNWKEVPRDSVALNRALAEQLQITSTGATVVLRFKKPSALAREATLSTKSDAEVAWRVKVHDILDEAQLGRFSLRANQSAVYNAFVNLQQLQELTQQTNRANVLLARQWEDVPHDYSMIQEDFLNGQLVGAWRLPDAQLELRVLSTNQIELNSSRIFLDPPAAKAALAITTNARPVLTYLVNLLRSGTNTTPYSMISALPAPMVPADLRDDEIIINQWLADDLQIGPGAELSISYFLMDSGTRLTERTNTFKVRAVVPMDSPMCDRTLMPEFPGIAKAESTSDWDAGFPLVHKIRTKDDQYWKQYRGTPKGFITLAAGQKLWGNRYGDLTAIRFLIQEENVVYGRDNLREGPKPFEQVTREAPAKIAKDILARFHPYHLGLRFEPVREQALAAASNSQDFGGLFIGFSFFLIIAALILTALMFRFGLEQRLSEAGLLLAVGYTPKAVRRIFLLEGLALAVIGSVIGVMGGVFYARAMLLGLTTLWKTATGISSLVFQVTPMSVGIGLVSGVLVAMFSLWLVLRKLGQQPATELLASQLGAPLKPLRGWPWFSALAVVAVVGSTLGVIKAGKTTDPGLFFGIGALLLAGAVGLSRWWLGRMAGTAGTLKAISMSSLSLRGCARRRGRSVATISLLACGSFLIAAIGVFRLDANRNVSARTAGTGGFTLLGDSSLPVLRDLNTAEGLEFYGLDTNELQGVTVVPMRVRDGDDASCLNLNRAQKPRLLGVNAAWLEGRFTFAAVIKGAEREDGWKLLQRKFAQQKLPDLKSDEVTAIGDAASIQWALGKKIGDTLDYTDEQGQTFKLRLVAGVANSNLQGNLLIDEAEFTRRFPSESGHRMFLLDVPSSKMAAVSAALTRALQNTGLEITPAARRLEQFNAVQNTYLNTFQVLGGLGLLLGTAGLAVVVLRNMLERRAELALLLALGFKPETLPRLVLREHIVLLALGLGIGVLAALVAVAPALLTPGSEIPYRSLGVTLGLVFATGLVWTWLAAKAAVRGNLLAALRNE